MQLQPQTADKLSMWTGTNSNNDPKGENIMAVAKTCDVVGCTLPARTVNVSIDTMDNDGLSIGTSRSIDVCDGERKAEVVRLFAECLDAIEMTIATPKPTKPEANP